MKPDEGGRGALYNNARHEVKCKAMMSSEFVNEEDCYRVKQAVAVEGATRHQQQLTKFRYQIKYKLFIHTSL